MKRFALLAWLAATACQGGGDGGGAGVPREYALTYERVYACRASVEHDLHQVAIWVSPDAADAYRTGRFPLPAGAVVVKEEFAPEDEACARPIGWTVMRKPASAAPDGGGTTDSWAYGKLDGRFAPVRDDSLPRCVACHAGCAARDFTCAN